MAWEIMGVNVGVIDAVAFLLWLTLGIGYHAAYAFYAKRYPLKTVKGKIHLYRRTWMKRILDRKDYILAVQTTRNLIMSANFLATASLLALGLMLNILLLTDPTAGALPLASSDLMEFQLLVLAIIYGFSFWSFLLSLRSLNQFTVLVAADPDLIDHIEGIDPVTYLTATINDASTKYTYGQRGFYYSTAIIAWVFSPMAFLVVTLVIGFFFVGLLDFQQWRLPRAVKREPGELGLR